MLLGNLKLSLDVIIPMFLMLGLGYFLRVSGMLDENFFQKGNKLTFKVLLPVLLFKNVYQTDIKSVFQPGLMFYGVGATVLVFLILMVVVPLFEKTQDRRGPIIQGIFRSNFIVFAIPMVNYLFGQEAVGLASTLIMIVVPVFNILSVVALEVYSPRNTDWKAVAKGIATNPLIIGALLGMAVVLLGIHLPVAVERAVFDLGGAATPVAFLILGGSFYFEQVGAYKKPLAVCVFCRLVLIPAVFLSIAALIGFRHIEFAVLMALFCAPTAVSTFAMADQAGADSRLAGMIVVFTSAFSAVTLFLFIFLFRTLGIL